MLHGGVSALYSLEGRERQLKRSTIGNVGRSYCISALFLDSAHMLTSLAQQGSAKATVAKFVVRKSSGSVSSCSSSVKSLERIEDIGDRCIVGRQGRRRSVCWRESWRWSWAGRRWREDILRVPASRRGWSVQRGKSMSRRTHARNVCRRAERCQHARFSRRFSARRNPSRFACSGCYGSTMHCMAA